MKSLSVIDGKGHLLGRLASICAKHLLIGKRIVVINCEKIEISGKEIKKKYKYFSMNRKKTNTNPKRGPFHFRSPSQLFWKTIRGMVPHKTKKGTKALLSLKVYEGMHPSLIKIRKLIVPNALRVLKLKPGRKYTNLGNISSELGWKRKIFIHQMNEKISSKNKVFFEKKKITINKEAFDVISNERKHSYYNKKDILHRKREDLADDLVVEYMHDSDELWV